MKIERSELNWNPFINIRHRDDDHPDVYVLPMDFPSNLDSMWKLEIRHEFLDFFKAEVGASTFRILSGSPNVVELPSIYWGVPSDIKKSKKDLAEIVRIIKKFHINKQINGGDFNIYIKIYARDERTGKVVLVCFDGSVNQLNKLKIDCFWPKVSSAINSGTLIAAFIFHIIISAFFIISFNSGLEAEVSPRFPQPIQ